MRACGCALDLKLARIEAEKHLTIIPVPSTLLLPPSPDILATNSQTPAAASKLSKSQLKRLKRMRSERELAARRQEIIKKLKLNEASASTLNQLWSSHSVGALRREEMGERRKQSRLQRKLKRDAEAQLVEQQQQERENEEDQDMTPPEPLVNVRNIARSLSGKGKVIAFYCLVSFPGGF